jgi:pyruvate kinase
VLTHILFCLYRCIAPTQRYTGTDSILFRAIDIGKEKGWVKTGDAIVCVHGAKEAVAGSTNSLRVLTA